MRPVSSSSKQRSEKRSASEALEAYVKEVQGTDGAEALSGDEASGGGGGGGAAAAAGGEEGGERGYDEDDDTGDEGVEIQDDVLVGLAAACSSLLHPGPCRCGRSVALTRDGLVGRIEQAIRGVSYEALHATMAMGIGGLLGSPPPSCTA